MASCLVNFFAVQILDLQGEFRYFQNWHSKIVDWKVHDFHIRPLDRVDLKFDFAN